ncbi:uroporphyrinogen-III C-methyltransferase [Oxobacter pfennigii]|uniref:uroporphyrinogen-III C-methyltransferase n=1 Tax=Oxobacter pfennigii TaxID=36849 RepID=A0A0P8WYV9_9CLOT|nr:uroporphyrinogen-III C-methyltransferase [Oxobacter pfennigii]KPU43615.1 uroporphyrinogen-III C-methyltransferase [Oxobacter pfennigii]
MGKVYLLGAGPGDEGLISVKAVKALEKCTAVMYDRLAGNFTLSYLNKDCKVFYCGKEPGSHYKTQDEINDMLVALAKEGHIVGRIKGGDPYVFGRGSEEALRLYNEGIDFEVIPGITSAISVLNYAGIPATHRKIAQSFHVFTGKSAKVLNINWNAAANLKGTLIFLMGLESIDEIISNLISNGMSKDTPCAVIREGTTSKQKKVTGTVSDISEKVKKAGFKSPCIIVMGEVVGFNEKLNWFEKKPLSGLNICVTRSKEQAVKTRERLYDLGAEVTEINSIEVVDTSWNLQSYIDKLEEYDYIVFTSVNGVSTFFERLKKLEVDIRKIKASFAAIGPATAEAIVDRGIIPLIVAEEFVAEALFEKMKEYIKRGDRILLPRSKASRSYLHDALKEYGCIVDEAHIYDIIEGNKPVEETFERVDIVLFTSPSTVKNMISMVGLDDIKKKTCIAIGPITSAELEKNGINHHVCKEYTIDGVIDKILELKEVVKCLQG